MADRRRLLIGVDVGGTNSDLVVLDPKRISEPNRGVLAWHKAVTTPDVSEGIESAIRIVLDDPSNDIRKEEIVSVSIGTTHFINAVIERDTNKLERVAVLRLCAGYGESLPPFGDFPEDLGNILQCYVASMDGGSQVNGSDIKPLDEPALRRHCEEIRKRDITCVAVIATFANINNAQELRAAEIIKEEIPGVEVVLSHTVSTIGFVERENATILNAAIKRFGRRLIKSFVRATKRIGLDCTILISQNDGTVLSTKDALETPIRTFSSGATNSMRGAAILCSADPEVAGKDVIVCDVGGTTTDIGLLLSTGFPRQSSTYSYVGGVKMNFSMPHVLSIGLGGGSIVRKGQEGLTVGPDSTGAEIVKQSLLCDGPVTTASDVAVGALADKGSLEALSEFKMGDISRVEGRFDDEYKKSFTAALKEKLERTIDRMKTSPDPIPVIMVGGGSFIAPDSLDGASKVIRPPYYQVANAIGAALGKISSMQQEFRTMLQCTDGEKENAIKELIKRAKNDAVSKGALLSSLSVVNIVCDAVPYVDKVYNVEVKLVGDIDYGKALDSTREVADEDSSDSEEDIDYATTKNATVLATEVQAIDYNNYKPTIKDGEWILTVTDIDFISVGAYILGCGGGGDPHSDTIELKRIVKNGGIIKVLTLDEFDRKTNGKGRAINVAYCGSPTLSSERLHANELLEAVELIERWEGRKAEGIFMFEIGGSNGLAGLWTAYKKNLPCIDIDLMGRAYPTQWQSLPSVYNDLKGYPYAALSDGNGMSLLFTSVANDVQMENLVRDAMNNHGVQCGVVDPTMDIPRMKKETVLNTLSLSWRIGRAVRIAQAKGDTGRLPDYIITAAGGPDAAKYLFKGKIISVEKKLERGYGYGVVIIKGLDDQSAIVKVPFKNENIVAYRVNADGTEEPICSVPDLITLVDEHGGAVGTQDYRYGLIVHVMAFAPSERWTSTPRGIEVGGPKGFGKAFENIEYKPIGRYIKPVPVSEEYGQ
ncbi:AaceriACR027Cp [[Ashbya] aceris (nom. inval.)]|nr:AaceriACR027Cp [[Ashbya] aceris (nom. inval.)]